MAYPGCPLFWLEPQWRVRVSLRRFSFGLNRGEQPRPQHRCCAAEPDTPSGYRGGCNATGWTDIERPFEPAVDPADGYRFLPRLPAELEPGRDDPRWPGVCEKCGCEFLEDDVWQVNQSELWIRGDTGAVVAFRGYSTPGFAGALFDAWHLHDGPHAVAVARAIAQIPLTPEQQTMVGPDGIALTAICPNDCAWHVDGPATGGGRWSRTGDPRNPATLTVQPSIICGDYHGFITNGAFTPG